MLAIALGVSACGGSRSPESRVRAAWSQLKSALVSQDAGKFCSLLSDHARSQVVEGARRLGSASTCQGAARLAFHAPGSSRSSTEKLQIVSITVNGDRASVKVSAGLPPTVFIKVGGAWKLKSLD